MPACGERALGTPRENGGTRSARGWEGTEAEGVRVQQQGLLCPGLGPSGCSSVGMSCAEVYRGVRSLAPLGAPHPAPAFPPPRPGRTCHRSPGGSCPFPALLLLPLLIFRSQLHLHCPCQLIQKAPAAQYSSLRGPRHPYTNHQHTSTPSPLSTPRLPPLLTSNASAPNTEGEPPSPACGDTHCVPHSRSPPTALRLSCQGHRVDQNQRPGAALPGPLLPHRRLHQHQHQG